MHVSKVHQKSKPNSRTFSHIYCLKYYLNQAQHQKGTCPLVKIDQGITIV